jgi:sugar phosphate isomerase/epimerase
MNQAPPKAFNLITLFCILMLILAVFHTEDLRAAEEDYPLRLGLASYTFRNFTLDETLAFTKRAGLKYIALKSFHLPLDATEADIKTAAAKVRAAGMTLYGGGVIYMNTEAEVTQAFRYARAAGMETIIGVPKHELLPLIERHVKEFDIQVAIHNHGPGDKNYPSPESVYEKVKDLDKRIGLCIDVGHTVRIGEDPARDIRRFADRVLDIHLKDVSAAVPEAKEIEAGHGVIDLPAILKALMKIRYKGVVAFEYEKDGDAPLPGLAESVGYFRGLMAGS